LSTEDKKEQTAKRALYLAVAALTLTALLIGALFVFFSDLIGAPFNGGKDPLRYSRTLEELRVPEGQWLSGLPSYGSFEIPLPMDVDVRKANVALNMITDVSENAVASLKISINGRRIYEKVLPTGRHNLNLQFPIEYGLDQGKLLRVAMSLNGDVGGIICLDDEDTGAVVQVLPDSGIQVQLRAPIYSVRDAIVMMPTKIKIALPTRQDNADWMRLAAAIGVHLSHLDYDVSFIPLGDITQILKRYPDEGIIVLGDIQALIEQGFDTGNLLGESPPKLITSRLEKQLIVGITSTEADVINELVGNPMLSLASRRAVNPIKLSGLRSSVVDRDVSLSSFGVDSTVQQVRFRRNWTVRYAIPDMPGAEIPERLRVRIRLPEGPGDFLNLVHVELNDNLIGSQRATSPGDSDLLFELPSTLQRMRNKLFITLQRHRDEGGCDMAEARFPVQILPESALLAPRKPRTGAEGFIELPKFFTSGLRVLVPTDYAGTKAPETLSVLLPVLAEFLSFAEIPDIALTDPSSEEIPTTPFLAYQYTPAGTDAIVYQPLQYSNGKRIIVDDNGERVVQDMDLINKAIAVEHVVSRKLIDKKRDVYQSTQGLVVTRSENYPKLIHADFGWENVLVFPDKEEGFEILKNGQIPLREDMRRDNGLLYNLEQ
tara:strand:+ start:8005 stop:9978 length:1974 start_codon:yes stop_codon:yes gene_type:complete